MMACECMCEGFLWEHVCMGLWVYMWVCLRARTYVLVHQKAQFKCYIVRLSTFLESEGILPDLYFFKALSE